MPHLAAHDVMIMFLALAVILGSAKIMGEIIVSGIAIRREKTSVFNKTRARTEVISTKVSMLTDASM